MIKHGFTIIFLLVSQTINAQLLFETFVGGAQSDIDPYHIIQNEDSSYILSGIILNDTTQGQDCFISKLSPNGALEWIKSYPMPSAEFYGHAIHGVDSGYLLGATTFSYPQNDIDSVKDIIALKVDPQGNEEWRIVIAARDFYSSCTCPDLSYVLVGEIWSQKDTSKPDIDPDLVVIKLDKNGSIIWKKELGTGFDDEAHHTKVFCDKSSNIYFGALTDSASDRYRNGMFYKLSSSGEVQYRRWFEEDPQDNKVVSPKHIFVSQNEHFYVRDNGVYRINLSNGNESLIRQFEDLEDIAVKNNNITAILGRKSLTNYHKLGYIRLDSDFNTYWKKEYEVDYRLWSRGVIPDLDFGSVYLFREGLNSGKFRAVVLKTDCNGNTDQWRNCTLGQTEEHLTAINLASVYPNPFNESVSIFVKTTGEYVILDSTGKRIRFGALKVGETLIDGEALPHGFYTIQITTHNGEIAFKKVVKSY